MSIFVIYQKMLEVKMIHSGTEKNDFFFVICKICSSRYVRANQIELKFNYLQTCAQNPFKKMQYRQAIELLDSLMSLTNSETKIKRNM